MADMYDDESTPVEDSSSVDSQDKKSDETEDQLALVPTSFFRDKNPKPGMREMVEVVNVYENEVSIKCVYGDDEKEEKEESPAEKAGEPEDDAMMS